MASEFGTLYYYSLLFKVVFALSMPHLFIYFWEDAVDTIKPAHLTLTRVFSCFPHRMKKFSMA